MMYDELDGEESLYEECPDEECLKKGDEFLLPSRKGIVRHSVQQINRLKYYYEMGMRGCSKKDMILIEKAANETGLTTEQVKV